MAQNTNAKPKLLMIVEPETKVRFRYASEGGSHGGLTGKKRGKEKVYPTVKLVGYSGKKRPYVKVSLFTEDKELHVLELKGSGGSVPHLKEYLQEDNTAKFTNLKILNKKREEICKLLMDRKLRKLGTNLSNAAKAEIEKSCGQEIKDRAKQILNSVRLCFEVFEEGKHSRLCEPLFSEVICNQKTASKGELRIHRMSQVAGSWRGGDEVILLCDKVQKENIMIEFYETDLEEEIVWEKHAIFTPADVHYQVAITFKTPQYQQNAERKVWVRLARGEDYSEPREYTFIPDFDEKPLKKRKLFNCEEGVNLSSYRQMVDTESANESSSNYNDSDSNPSPEVLQEGTFENVDEFFPKMNLDEAFNDVGLTLQEIEQIELDYHLNSDDLIYSPQSMTSVHDGERLVNHSLDCVDGSFNQDGEILSQRMPFVDAGNRVLEFEYNCSQSKWRQGLNLVSGFLQMDFGNLGRSLKSMTLGSGENSHTSSNTSDAENRLAEGRLKRLRAKQKMNSLLTRRDFHGNTLLHVAVLVGRDITTLLEATRMADGNVINLQNFDQETALHIATRLNKVETVKKLLEFNASPNLKNKGGNNCYHLASENISLNVMFCLLSHVTCTPQLDAFNYEGLSPLHLAVKNKSEGCYNLLKAHSADLSTREQTRGRSLLHYAVEFCPSFLATLLKDEEILELIDAGDFEGNTPLHLASTLGDVGGVKQLLQAGADPLVRNKKHSESNEDNCGETVVDLSTNNEIKDILLKTSSRISARDEVIEELCELLDVDEKWKNLALYFVDEKFIDSLQFSTSPTKALLDHVQKENTDNFIENLKNSAEMAGLEDALMVFRKKDL